MTCLSRHYPWLICPKLRQDTRSTLVEGVQVTVIRCQIKHKYIFNIQVSTKRSYRLDFENQGINKTTHYQLYTPTGCKKWGSKTILLPPGSILQTVLFYSKKNLNISTGSVLQPPLSSADFSGSRKTTILPLWTPNYINKGAMWKSEARIKCSDELTP